MTHRLQPDWLIFSLTCAKFFWPSQRRHQTTRPYYQAAEWRLSEVRIGFMELWIPYWMYRNRFEEKTMTTFTSNFPALPLIAPIVALFRKRPDAPRATVAAPAAGNASVWSLYRMSAADSVSPKVAAALAARAAN
jgi:hypothetical protein